MFFDKICADVVYLPGEKFPIQDFLDTCNVEYIPAKRRIFKNFRNTERLLTF